MHVLDHHAAEQIAAFQVPKRASIRRGMAGADFENTAPLEFDPQDEMVCHRIALRSTNWNSHNRPLMDAVNKIAFGERSDGFFPIGRRDGRLR